MPKDEASYRALFMGARLINSAGLLLDLPQPAIYAACVVFHRYYLRVPILESSSPGWCPVGSVARACLLLGCKLEERVVPIARILSAFHATDIASDSSLRAAVASGSVPARLTPEDPSFWSAKRDVIRAESIILTRLGFMVDVETPLKPLASYSRVLGLPASVFGRALAVCNDIMRIDSCAKYPAHVVACGAIFVAARITRIPMPENDDENDFPWWFLFDVNTKDILDVVNDIQYMYSWAKSNGIGAVEDPPSLDDDDSDDDDDDDD